ncbi:DUF6221 family protein [Streptomyces sp. NPDC127098]|uniref:DUF6221 family protein n=1 Tax=Streptomyces sp. NPDC127098 TaxID=3347137 RepID=UPI00365BFFBD
MEDLIAFVRARLDEDEEIAKAPTGAAWAQANWDYHENEIGGEAHVDLGTNHLDATSSLNQLEMRHVARHDPARVLREIEAKRRLLDMYDSPETSPALPDSFNRFARDITRSFLGDIFRQLATVWAYHPDYRQEWKP